MPSHAVTSSTVIPPGDQGPARSREINGLSDTLAEYRKMAIALQGMSQRLDEQLRPAAAAMAEISKRITPLAVQAEAISQQFAKNLVPLVEAGRRVNQIDPMPFIQLSQSAERAQEQLAPFLSGLQLTLANAKYFNDAALREDKAASLSSRLVDDPDLRDGIEQLVRSSPVRDIVAGLAPEDLTDEVGSQARLHAAQRIQAEAEKRSELTTADIVAIFAALITLTTAAIASTYNYDVGKVSDVVAWPLAVLGLHAFLDNLRRR